MLRAYECSTVLCCIARMGIFLARTWQQKGEVRSSTANAWICHVDCAWRCRATWSALLAQHPPPPSPVSIISFHLTNEAFVQRWLHASTNCATPEPNFVNFAAARCQDSAPSGIAVLPAWTLITCDWRRPSCRGHTFVRVLSLFSKGTTM